MKLRQKLAHKMFGWDYAEVEFGYDFFVRRVMWDGDNRPFVRICGRHIDLYGERDRKWFPLTFPRAAHA